MPLNDFQKEWVVKQAGYDPANFTVDEATESIIPKQKAQPSSGAEAFHLKSGDDVSQLQSIGSHSAAGTFFKSAAEAAPSAIAGGVVAGGTIPMATAAAPFTYGASFLIPIIAGALTGGLTREAQKDIEPEEWQRDVEQARREHPLAGIAGDLSTIPLGGFSPNPLNTAKAAGTLYKYGRAGIPGLLSGETTALSDVANINEIRNLANVVMGAGIPAGMNAVEQLSSGEKFNLPQMLEQAAIGSVFNSPNALGRMYGFHNANEVKVEPNASDLQLSTAPKVPANLTSGDAQSEFYKNIAGQLESQPVGSRPVKLVTDPKTGKQKIVWRRTTYPLNEEGANRLFKQTGGAMGEEKLPKVTERMREKNPSLANYVEEMNRRRAAVDPDQLAAMEGEGGIVSGDVEGNTVSRTEDFFRAKQEKQIQDLQDQVSDLQKLLIKNQIGSGETRTKPLVTTELGRDVMPDYTGVTEHENLGAAAESAADLEARRLEGNTGDKYSTGSDIGGTPRTALEKETKAKIDEGTLPNTPTKSWVDFFQRLGLLRNYEITADGSITDSQGRPVAASTVISDAFKGLVKINPDKAGAPEFPHEATHVFINLLRESTRPRDVQFLRRYESLVKQLPDYKEWKPARDKKRHQSTPEEYIATNAGMESIRRALNMEGESGFRKWKNDFDAYLKTRFGKHADESDFRRILNYKLLNDPAYNKMLGIAPPVNQPLHSTGSAISEQDKLNSTESLLPAMHENVMLKLDKLAEGLEDGDISSNEAANIKSELLSKHDWSSHPALLKNLEDLNPTNLKQVEGFIAKWEAANKVAPVVRTTEPIKPETAPIVEQQEKRKLLPNIEDDFNNILEQSTIVKNELEAKSLDAEAGKFAHKALMEQVKWEDLPAVKSFLESDKFNAADPNSWNEFRKLYIIESGKVRGKNLNPDKLLSTIDKPVETEKPVTATEKVPKQSAKPIPSPEKVAKVQGQEVIEAGKPSAKPIDLSIEPLTEEQQKSRLLNIEREWQEIDAAKSIGDYQRLKNRMLGDYQIALHGPQDTMRAKENSVSRRMILRMQFDELQRKFKQEGNLESFLDEDQSRLDSALHSTESLLKQTETPEFKKWFGASKVVDEEGRPLVVYHGTAGNDFSEFNTERPYNPNKARYLGGPDAVVHGAYFTPHPKYSESYTGSLRRPDIDPLNGEVSWQYDEGARQYPVFLNIKNPKRMFQGYGFLTKAQIDSLKADGYDGVFGYRDQFGSRGQQLTISEKWAQVKPSDLIELVAFEPEQIKSAIGNKGTFDPNDPDITHSTESLLPPLVTSGIENIKRLEHPKAVKLADSLTDTYRYWRQYNGKLTNDVINKLLSHISWLSPVEAFKQDNQMLRNVHKYMFDMAYEGKSNVSLTPEEQQIYKDVRANLVKSATEKNNLIATIPGTKVKPTNINPNYAPMIPSRRVVDILVNKPFSTEAQQLRADWENYHVNKLGKTKAQSDEAFKIFKAGFSKPSSDLVTHFGPIDDPSGFGIPRSFVEPNLVDVMARFNNRYSRRLAYLKGIEADPDANDALNNPQTGLKGSDYVKTVMDDLMGIREPEEMKRVAIAGLIRAGMLGPLTGMKDVAAGQTLGLQHQSWDQLIGAKVYAWSHIKDSLVKSYESGVNRPNLAALEMGDDSVDNMFRILRRSRDVLNTVQGRNFLEKISRATNYGEGVFLANDNLIKYRTGNLNSQGTRFLKEFMPDYANYKTGNIPAEVINEAAARYVESVQGTYDYRNLPAISQRGTLAPVLSLARWNIEKLNNFEKHVVRPLIKEGDYKPMLMATLGALIGGEAVNQIVQLVTDRKEKTPNYRELAALAKDKNAKLVEPVLYKAAGLASLSGFGGILGDLTKSIMDIRFKNRPQSYQNPLISGADAIATNVKDAIDAFSNGDFNIGMDVLAQSLEDMLQVYRVGVAQLSSEKKAENEKRDKFRDLKLFKTTHDLPVGNVTSDRANPFKDQDIKRFKEEGDIGEAQTQLSELLKKALQKSNGNPEKLRAELKKIKQNSYQTMPSPESVPLTFLSYLNYLKETQGEEAATKRLNDYLQQNFINSAKSAMVPSI